MDDFVNRRPVVALFIALCFLAALAALGMALPHG
jgi:hypothetical protein